MTVTRSWMSGVRPVLVGFAVALALALAPSPAQAQSKAKAKKLYKEARTKYDLGDFGGAVKLFKDAYAELPSPEFLFNIAQAYRQMGDCRNAAFFYKRFLALKKDIEASVEADVRNRITELEDACRTAEKIADKPPDRTMEPDKAGGSGSSDGDGERVAEADGDGDGDGDGGDTVGGGDTGGSVVKQERSAPNKVASRVEFGTSFLSIGDLEISGAQFSFAGGLGYPISFGDSAGLVVGGMFTFTPVPWQAATGEEGTASLTTLLLNTELDLRVMRKLILRAEVGVGAMFLGGLEEGNVFVPPETMATGTLSMINVRVSVGAEYSLTSNLAFTVTPAIFSFSPAKDGLRDGIDSFNRFELLAGIGYRL